MAYINEKLIKTSAKQRSISVKRKQRNKAREEGEEDMAKIEINNERRGKRRLSKSKRRHQSRAWYHQRNQPVSGGENVSAAKINNDNGINQRKTA